MWHLSISCAIDDNTDVNMGNVPMVKLVGSGKGNKLTKFQRQKLKYDFNTFFGKLTFQIEQTQQIYYLHKVYNISCVVDIRYK